MTGSGAALDTTFAGNYGPGFLGPPPDINGHAVVGPRLKARAAFGTETVRSMTRHQDL
jgi:hypothetical protein